jgi:hypothetical protein
MFRSVNKSEKAMALGLVLLGVLFRLLPHPENFTPTMAIAVFAGVVLPAALSLTIPLVIMVISDCVIGFHPLFLVIWSSFLLVSLVGNKIRNSAGWLSVSAATMAGSLIFFIISNLSVFVFQNMYAKTWAGFVECFTMALPFFRNSFLADVFYCFVLFGLFTLARLATRKVSYVRP